MEPGTAWLVTGLLSAILLHRLWRRLSRLPPGPWGLPLLGILPFLRSDIRRQFAELNVVYGPVLSFRLGTELQVLVGSGSVTAEILNDVVFANRLNRDVPNTIFLPGGDIAFTPHGPLWKTLRHVAVRELLSPTAVNSFHALRQREMLRMLQGLRASTGCVTDVRSALYSYSANVMMGMIWDEALKEGETQMMAKEIKTVVEGFLEVLTAPNVSDFIPSLAWLDLQGLRRRARRISARFDVIFRSVLDRKVSRGRGCDGDEGSKDFLQIMLDLVGKGDPDVNLQPQHMRDLTFNMITGGTDTTAATVEWAISELVRNPNTMARLQEELDAVAGDDGILDESRLLQLNYLDAVVKENLRLNPIFPILSRIPSATCEVGGYRIPRGTAVFMNAWAIQRDPSVWKEPLEFRPERFLEEGKERWGYGEKKSSEYMPFGGGVRVCAGLKLAERMAKYMLASLVHSFHWRLPPGTETIDMEADLGFINKRVKPLVLVPYSRI